MIPRVIHFVFGLAPEFGGKPFSFVHWAAIKSAIANNPGYRILFWHCHLPDNPYFADVRTQLELMPVAPPESIFDRPLVHVAHKADVVRLRALIEHGGIYLDMDTVTVASFEPLRDNEFVLGTESQGGTAVGLCNAIMLSAQGAPFARAWLDEYRSFRSQGLDPYWNEHSVKVPARLAASMKDHVTILPDTSFFYPDATSQGLDAMFFRTRDFPLAIAHHLWETVSWGALRRVNERNVGVLHNSYTRILERHLAPDIERLAGVRRAWVDEAIASGNAALHFGTGGSPGSAAIYCDPYAESGADRAFDMARDPWPFPADSVTSIMLHHVLEHLGGDLRHFFVEMYRVAKGQAAIEIRVAHPRHDAFLVDPTHVRPWHQESFLLLDRSKCLQDLASDVRTPLALLWGIDFEFVKASLLVDNAVAPSIRAAFGNAPDVGRVATYLNNCISEIVVLLRVRK